MILHWNNDAREQELKSNEIKISFNIQSTILTHLQDSTLHAVWSVTMTHGAVCRHKTRSEWNGKFYVKVDRQTPNDWDDDMAF